MSSHVTVDARLFVKSFVANWTEMCVLLSVMLFMEYYRVSVGESSQTNITLKGLALPVESHVLFQVRLSCKSFGASVTLVILHLVVHTIHVDLEVVQSLEGLMANVATGTRRSFGYSSFLGMGLGSSYHLVLVHHRFVLLCLLPLPL